MEKTTGEKMAKELSNFVNNFNCDVDGFVREITNQHRTLQQNAFRLFMRCIVEWANRDDCQFDLRNEATVKICKEIMKIENCDAIPFI